jgi:hypothetical protein
MVNNALARKLLLLWLGIFSCTTKEGNIISFNAGAGALVVNSSVSNARIFVDYRDTGKKTPALIENLPAGIHVVHLFLDGHKAIPDSMLARIQEGEEIAINFDLQQTASAGDLEVNTTPSGALVYIDKLPFGRTPLRVTGLLSGAHSVRISKGGYATIRQSIRINVNQRSEIQRALLLQPQRILVEHFSNTDCAPCPEADAIIEAVLQQKGVDSVAVLSYHPDFPGKQDPFYLAAPNDNLARYGYYSRPPLPFVVIDGIKPMAGTFNLETRFKNALAERAGKTPAATLDFWELLESHQEFNAITGRVRVEALQDLSAANVYLRLALVERDITLPVAPGSNGQKHFFDVMRGLRPSPDGLPISLAKGQSAFYDFRFERKSEWQGDLQVVAFLQNNTDRQVLQSLWSVGY